MAGLGLVIITLTSALAAVTGLGLGFSLGRVQPVHGPSTPRPAYAVTARVREHRHGP